MRWKPAGNPCRRKRRFRRSERHGLLTVGRIVPVAEAHVTVIDVDQPLIWRSRPGVCCGPNADSCGSIFGPAASACSPARRATYEIAADLSVHCVFRDEGFAENWHVTSLRAVERLCPDQRGKPEGTVSLKVQFATLNTGTVADHSRCDETHVRVVVQNTGYRPAQS